MRRAITVAISLLVSVAVAATAQGDLIPYQTLRNYLPATLGGMSLEGEPSGTTMTSEGYSMSMVVANYAGGDMSGAVAIHHGVTAGQQFSTQQQMGNMSIENDQMRYRTITVNGFPAIEHLLYDERSAMVYVLVGENLVVTIHMQNVDSAGECIACAEAMDLQGLAALAN